MKTEYSDIIAAQEEVKDVERKYLTYRNWKYTCATPGSYWLWSKELPNGKTALLQTSMAVSIQMHLDDA